MPPRNDCRLTLRYLKAAGLKLKLTEDFAVLAQQDETIKRFIERRREDENGGESGERVQQIRSRPAFKLTSERLRGATWFDQNHPPQDIVWLLGMEWHDERAKGRNDAYDILGNLDEAEQLFPDDLDYKRLELDRRRWDSENFARDAQDDALGLVRELLRDGKAQSPIAGIGVSAVIEKDDLWFVYFSVSDRPITGRRSGYALALTPKRFGLLRAAVARALTEEAGEEVLTDDSPHHRQPLSLPSGRRFLALLNPP